MSDYYREQGFRSRKRIVRRLRLFVILLLLAVLIGVGFLAYDVYRQSQRSDTATKNTAPVTSTIVSNSTVQSSRYFQFRAPSKWRPIANETRDGYYVYRQFNSQLPEQDLVVEVNNTAPEALASVQTAYVLPVVASSTGALTPQGSVSEHCKKYIKPGTEGRQQIAVFNKVSFACAGDSRSYIVVVGLVGGNTNMQLPRPDGSTATYKITYKNLTVSQSPRDLKGIIETFETR